MKRQKKKENGITLIALVISIIVMLILAGVSLNATVGENGIITRAQEAAEASKKASIIEEIQSHLMKYNIDLLSGDKKTAAKTAIDNLINDEVVDNCMAADGSFTTDTTKLTAIPLTAEDGSWVGEFEYVVGKDNYMFNIYQDKDGMFKAEISDIIAGSGAVGGEVTGGKTLVTSEAFTSGDSNTTDENEKGKYTIVGDASVIFANELSGSYSIYVKSGANATVSIFYSMTLSNNNLQRSAIDIEPGGTLNLWIAEGATVKVDSGFGLAASVDDTKTPGTGAYAGIHCWKNGNETSVLNLSGSGILISRAGDASDGGAFTGADQTKPGGAGGGGAGAGIGGNGGDGSIGIGINTQDGGRGEDCGIVTISGNMTVYAFGGAGGSAGISLSSAGSGGGGYPAAGIGGGGAGAASGTSCCSGGGGYNGGDGKSFSSSRNGHKAENGYAGDHCYGSYKDMEWNAGGYFEGPGINIITKNLYDKNGEKIENVAIRSFLGGKGARGADGGLTHMTGDGGIAGSGGIIKVSETAKVYAYNGNRYTDGLTGHESPDYYNSELININNQCPIYAQSGIKNTEYDYASFSGENRYTEDGIKHIIAEARIVNNGITNLTKSGYYNSINNNIVVKIIDTDTSVDMKYQGIGSGAGYIENNNGTYEGNLSDEQIKSYINSL